MAHEMRQAISRAEKMIVTYETSSPRLWYPRLTWAWLGAAPRAYIVDEPSTFLNQEDTMTRATTLSYEETQRGFDHVDDNLKQRMFARLQTEARRKKKGPLKFSLSGASLFAYRTWNGSRMLHMRLRLSIVFKYLVHSRHVQHGLKNAGGVALLALPAFMSANSEGKSRLTPNYSDRIVDSSRASLVQFRAWRLDDYQFCLGP